MLFGYPPDRFPEFCWISSLENRFEWVVNNISSNKSASKYLIKEMIEWGGSQNGVLQKFNDASGEVNLYEIIKNVIDVLHDPKQAITNSLALPGLGLTYASKLLRFLKPEMYGALDSRIRKALVAQNKLPKINDGQHNSMVTGYTEFINLLQEIKNELKIKGISKPECGLSKSIDWRAAEIEMALFYWAEDQGKR